MTGLTLKMFEIMVLVIISQVKPVNLFLSLQVGTNKISWERKSQTTLVILVLLNKKATIGFWWKSSMVILGVVSKAVDLFLAKRLMM